MASCEVCDEEMDIPPDVYINGMICKKCRREQGKE